MSHFLQGIICTWWRIKMCNSLSIWNVYTHAKCHCTEKHSSWSFGTLNTVHDLCLLITIYPGVNPGDPTVYIDSGQTGYIFENACRNFGRANQIVFYCTTCYVNCTCLWCSQVMDRQCQESIKFWLESVELLFALSTGETQFVESPFNLLHELLFGQYLSRQCKFPCVWPWMVLLSVQLSRSTINPHCNTWVSLVGVAVMQELLGVKERIWCTCPYQILRVEPVALHKDDRPSLICTTILHTQKLYK